MKKIIILSLLVVGMLFLLGAAGPVSAGTEPSPFRPRGVVWSVATELSTVNSQLEKVLNTIGPPVAPIPQEILLELVAIQNAASIMTDLTGPYLGSTELPVDPEPDEPLGNAKSNSNWQAKFSRVSAITVRMENIKERLSDILTRVGSPDDIDEETQVEFTRVNENATTIAQRCEPYTGGTTPPPPSDNPL